MLVYLLSKRDRSAASRQSDHAALRQITQTVGIIRSDQEAANAKLDDVSTRLARIEGRLDERGR